MSAHTVNKPSSQQAPPVTSVTVRNTKGQRKLVMLTAYDYPTALLLDEGGVDMILVGDSLGMVVLGRSDTVAVTLEEIIHHTSAVTSAVRRALVIADMPFMTYEQGVAQALINATQLVQRSGVRAVKMEGGKEIAPQVAALVQAGIPVMGHIGLTPQRAACLGGFKVQGKTVAAAIRLQEDAKALEDAGCFSLVLEAIPAAVAAGITASVAVPTIGIGAGADCDGQVLVFHDLVGLTQGHTPRFVKRYANMATLISQAVQDFSHEVQAGAFPTAEHSFSMPASECAALAEADRKVKES